MSKQRSRRMRFSDRLRKLIDASGMSRYRVCKEIGISQAAMSRFMSGHHGLAMSTIDRLCELLDLELARRKRPRRKPKGR